MTLQHIRFDQFEAKPWKNGLGTTYDIALLPEQANHTSFDLRFALSPILEDNIFSAFPGIERVITPIEGKQLRLEFDDKISELALHTSLRFDSALTPMGRPTQGPVKVINVMGRQEKWRIQNCGVTEESEYNIEAGEMLFLFAVENCTVQSSEQVILIAKNDAAIATGPDQISIKSASKTKILSAHLQPI